MKPINVIVTALIMMLAIGFFNYKYLVNEINTTFYYPTVQDIHKRFVLEQFDNEKFISLKESLTNHMIVITWTDDYSDTINKLLNNFELVYLRFFNKKPTLQSAYSSLIDSNANILKRYIFSVCFIHPKENDTLIMNNDSKGFYCIVKSRKSYLLEEIEGNLVKFTTYRKQEITQDRAGK